jgi:hypothetical protein
MFAAAAAAPALARCCCRSCAIPAEVEHFLRWAQETWGFSVQRITAEIPAEYRVHDVLVVRMQLIDAESAADAAAKARAGTLERGY